MKQFVIVMATLVVFVSIGCVTSAFSDTNTDQQDTYTETNETANDEYDYSYEDSVIEEDAPSAYDRSSNNKEIAEDNNDTTIYYDEKQDAPTNEKVATDDGILTKK